MTPAALTALDQWVIAGADKIPLDPTTGHRADTTDPATWGTFAQASAAAGRRQYLVGFVFTKAGRLVGIDLDHCRDPETGEIEPWARRVVRLLNTYTEISVSGTGLHIILYGTLPPGRRVGRIEGCEVGSYDDGRYFVMTGNVLPGYDAIAERTDELAQLRRAMFGDEAATSGSDGTSATHQRGAIRWLDDELVDRALKAKNGQKVRDLLDGNTDAYPSRSEADAATAEILCFWTPDNDQVVRLLMRYSTKAQEEGERYARRTVAYARRLQTEAYSPPRPVAAPDPMPFPAAPDTGTLRVRSISAPGARLRVREVGRA